jgi:hypothetical protein
MQCRRQFGMLKREGDFDETRNTCRRFEVTDIRLD